MFSIKLLLLNTHYLAPSRPLFCCYGILDIFDLNTLCIGNFMFLYHHNLLPSSFANLFMTNSQIHHYNTRTSHNYKSHFCHTNIKKFTVLFNGPKVWNSLPSYITCCTTKKAFKKKLNSYLS